MNKKSIKIIVSSFIFINLLSTFPKTTLADSNQYNSSDDSIETSIENIDDLKDNKKENNDITHLIICCQGIPASTRNFILDSIIRCVLL